MSENHTVIGSCAYTHHMCVYVYNVLLTNNIDCACDPQVMALDSVFLSLHFLSSELTFCRLPITKRR
jgi:hypothetical protein